MPEISIHAPREGSDQIKRKQNNKKQISIHAPREGSDTQSAKKPTKTDISIHAPREGSDAKVDRDNNYMWYFNPRSP